MINSDPDARSLTGGGRSLHKSWFQHVGREAVKAQ